MNEPRRHRTRRALPIGEPPGPLDRPATRCHDPLVRALLTVLGLCLLVACGDDDGSTADGGPDAAMVDMGPGVEIRLPESDAPGPGLGNLSYAADELNEPIAFIDHDNGVPPPENAARAFKPMGTNVAYMHHGYLLTLAASDSGIRGGALLFYDVSDPRNPVLVQRIYEPRGRTADFREAHSMGFMDHEGMELVALHTAEGIEIWDLRDTRSPERLSRLDLPEVNGGDYVKVAWQLFWQGSVLYVGASEEGIHAVDTSDPANPRLIRTIPTGELGGIRIGPIFVVGNLLVATSMDNGSGFSVLDVSSPANPVLLGTSPRDLPKIYAYAFTGGHVVASQRGAEARLLMWDVDDPLRLEAFPAGPVIDEQLYNASQDHFVFQGNEHDWTKVDVRDPRAAVIVGSGELGRERSDHGQVTPFGNLLWVGNDHGTGSAPFPHQRAPATTPPAVSFVSPRDGAVFQRLGSRVGVTMTDNVLVESVTDASFVVRPLRDGGPGAPVPGRHAVQNGYVNFTPDAPLEAETEYEVLLRAGGVRDWAENAIAEDFRSTFRTGPADEERLVAALESSAPAAVGETVLFTVRPSILEGTEASFDFGDGGGRGDRGPIAVERTFDAPGHYTVIAEVTNGDATVTASTTITIHRPIVGTPERSGTLAVTDDEAFVVNRDQGTVSRVFIEDGVRAFETSVCAEPANLTFTADRTLYVSCRDDVLVQLDPDTGAEIRRHAFRWGARPAGVVTDDDGQIQVLLEGVGELVRLHRMTFEETSRVPVFPGARGLAHGPDGTLYASRFISPGVGPDAHGEVARIAPDHSSVELPTLAQDTTTVDAEDRSRGVPNYLGAPSPSPGGADLWIPSKQDNVARGLARDGQPLTFESSVRAVVNRIALSDDSERPRRDINDRALPVDVALSPLGDYALVAFLASDEIAILDGYTGQTMGAIGAPEDGASGLAPQAVRFTPDGRHIVVHDFLSRTVRIYDGRELLANVASAPRLLRVADPTAGEALTSVVLRGKRIFYAASDPRMSQDGYLSCATCHLDGDQDGNRFFVEDGGFPDVLGNSLKDVAETLSKSHGGLGAVLALADKLAGDRDPLHFVMPWFGQAMDAPDGRMYLGRPWWKFWARKSLQMDWDVAGSQAVVSAMVDMHKRLSAATGGTAVEPPTWTLFRDLITPHPLGGCGMADDARNGVVDAKGRVYGHPGLYVADGAIFPGPVGLNPSRTIAALAEHIAGAMIAE